MKELVCQLAHVKLNYIETDSNGIVMLLIHGNMGRWQAFSPIISEIEKNAHIYALDLRGHGKSTHVDGTYMLQDHLSDVVAFINEKIKAPVVLFGMSLGGMIGLMVAARFPELIKGLILADSPLSTETLFPIVESQVQIGERILNYINTKQIDKLYQEINDDFSSESFCLCDPEIIKTTFYQYKDMVKGYEMDALFPSLKCPTLILHGETSMGSMISDSDIERAVKLSPYISHVKIGGVGHSLLEKKEIVMSELMKFVDKHVKR